MRSRRTLAAATPRPEAPDSHDFADVTDMHDTLHHLQDFGACSFATPVLAP